MNIHEYQAKQILRQYGVSVPEGNVAYTPEQAYEVAEKLSGPVYVVKSQIHAGGRGQGHFKGDGADAKGGVRVVKSADHVKKDAQDMLGKILVTHQTGPEGKEVKKVYVEQGCNIAQELYMSLLLDRVTSTITFVASTEGGMDIEKVAAQSPEKIISLSINPITGFQPHYARDLSVRLGLNKAQMKKMHGFMSSLYECFVKEDAALLEINPLVITGDDDILALDCKMSFDDNALFRHPDSLKLRDEDEEDPKELEAAKHGLNYIKLDGSIGCMVNGAGLAMATMDIIQLYGENPANFLDVGGGATQEKVAVAFKIILSDENVTGILINIFGGIMRCDVIAQGVVAAAKEVSLNVPLVVRLEGTNVELGREILANSALPIISADNLDDAAKKIIAAVKEVE